MPLVSCPVARLAEDSCLAAGLALVVLAALPALVLTAQAASWEAQPHPAIHFQAALEALGPDLQALDLALEAGQVGLSGHLGVGQTSI